MKNKSTSRAAFFNLHASTAAVLRLTSVVVALVGFGAFSTTVFGQETRIKANSFIPAGCMWSSIVQDMPTPLVRAFGVYHDGNFYVVGGSTSDTPGSDFPHVLELPGGCCSWIQRSDTLPDNQVSNMACGVLTVSGTHLIYCVGGSAVGASVATARVFSYNPSTDTHTVLNSVDDWPGNPGSVLPGGFAVANNKLYILGGFNINVASTNAIWEFDPNAAEGSRWTEKVNAPVGIMFAPACTINGIIYVAGASDFQGGSIVDTTNSFSFDPVANTIGSIAPIPRATGEARALSFNDNMLVMGGGRVAPNPSNEVDTYDPPTDTWTTSAGVLVPVGVTVPSFTTARRDFPSDTDGSQFLWLSGGYDADGKPLSSTESAHCPGAGGPPPRATPTPCPRPTPHPRP